MDTQTIDNSRTTGFTQNNIAKVVSASFKNPTYQYVKTNELLHILVKFLLINGTFSRNKNCDNLAVLF